MKNIGVLKMMVMCGMGSMVIGLPYICYVFWALRTEVFSWGLAAIFLGMLLIAMSVAISHLDNPFSRLVLSIGHSALILMQIPPVVFWLTYHGNSVSGANSPLAFNAHWALAMPHMALLVVALMVILRVNQNNYSRQLET